MSTGKHGGRGTARMSQRQSKAIHDALARSMGWKDYADACKHKDKNGKVGHGPNWKRKK